jgi:hypothetical protein
VPYQSHNHLGYKIRIAWKGTKNKKMNYTAFLGLLMKNNSGTGEFNKAANI